MYHRQVARFSDDLDIQVIPPEALERGPKEHRIAAFQESSADFKRHIHRALPFLELTCLGRFRKRDGRFESHIFVYRLRRPHPDMQPGLKPELAQRPPRLPLEEDRGLWERSVHLVSAFKVAMGKWQAVGLRFGERAFGGLDYARHALDLALIGSRMQGDHGPGSDLDIALVGGLRRNGSLAGLPRVLGGVRPGWIPLDRDRFELPPCVMRIPWVIARRGVRLWGRALPAVSGRDG